MLKKQREFIKNQASKEQSLRQPEVRIASISNFRRVELKFTEIMILPENFAEIVEESLNKTERVLDVMLISGDTE